ncbi:MAG: SurA N-terminal domain-containing protein [Candidatus Thermoplasmatota archaeon]|nr:SurA N-terminal domain-containing protein [Candidatus Thermoplasmatota archaeon]
MNSKQIIKWIFVIIAISSLLVCAGCTEQSEDDDQAEDETDGNTTDATVAAIVNGEEILMEEVTSLQQSYIQQGQQITEQQALELVIDQTILLQQAKQGDYMPTDAETETQIESILAQQGSTLEQYKQQLQQQGTSYEDFLQNYKEQLAIQNYEDDELEGQTFNVTDQEAQEYYDMYVNQSSDPSQIPPYEQVKQDIISSLEQQKRQEAVNVLVETLKEEADIEYKI